MRSPQRARYAKGRGEPASRGDRALTGTLDGRAVCGRVAEGDAQLEHPGARRDARVREREALVDARVADAQVRDEHLVATPEQGVDALQEAVPMRASSVERSLSPRPDRHSATLTGRPWASAISRATSQTRARAWADSRAGRMPSLRASRLPAASASSSLAERDFARPLSLRHACCGPTPG